MKVACTFRTRGRLALMPAVLICGLQLLNAGPLTAQTATGDEDHEHDHLHFSHPLVTESPSPDSKLRFDAIASSSSDPDRERALDLRMEGEYGFSNSFSIALVIPFERISSPADARASAFGSVELSAKAASFAFAESGGLLGGGLTLELPTGSDTKAIGSGHLIGLAPFVDVALMRGPLESVAMLTYSSAANRNSSDADLNALTLDASLLWHVVPTMELLGEVTTSRSIGSASISQSETFLAPGIKWRPSSLPKLALGVSFLRGLGSSAGDNAVQATAFWHF